MSVPSGARAITTSTVTFSRPMMRSIHSPLKTPGSPQSRPSSARNRTVSSRSSTTRPMCTKSVTPRRLLSIEIERWQDLVPDLGERAAQLAEALGSTEEPPVQVLGALAPAADVHARDAADGEDGALDAPEHHALLAGELVGEVRRAGNVHARLEDHDDRQPGRLAEADDAPALRRPQVVGVRLRARAAAVAALSLERGLGRQRRQGLRPDRALERPRVPVLDGWRAEGAGGAGVELLGRLGHRARIRWDGEVVGGVLRLAGGGGLPVLRPGAAGADVGGRALVLGDLLRRLPRAGGDPARADRRRVPRAPRRRADRAHRRGG